MSPLKAETKDLIRISRMALEDAGPTRDLIIETFTGLSGPDVVERWYDDVRQMEVNYVHNPAQAAFVARTGDSVIGAAVVRHRCPTIPALAGRYNPVATCELGRLAVSPRYRRSGLGRALVEAARKWARTRYAVLSLHCDSENEPALRLWRSICTEIHTSPENNSVYFELPLDKPLSPSVSLAGAEGGSP